MNEAHDWAAMLVILLVLFSLAGIAVKAREVLDRCRRQREVLPPPVDDPRDTTGAFKRIFWENHR